MSFGFVIAAILIALIVVVVVTDVATAPTPTKGQCLLDRRFFLPDVCLNSCSQPFDCTRTTRPYGIFFTQSATCVDAVICG
jgi:hypothetical protein